MRCVPSASQPPKTGKQNGERVEHTEWHNIVLYRKLAEIAQQYLVKGRQVYIEGSIRSRKYQDKNGVDRTAYEVICSSMKMLGTKDHAVPLSESGNTVTHKTNTPASATDRAIEEEKPQEIIDDLDDDIPF